MISPAAFTPDTAKRDPRFATHVSMVEQVDSKAVSTIDGNAPLVMSDKVASSPGSHQSNAVGGRTYFLDGADNPKLGEGGAYFYHQSRLIALVRVTDRKDTFATSGGNAGAAAGATVPTGEQLLARLDAANAQVEAVLNALPGTTTVYRSSGSVATWLSTTAH